MRAVKFDNYGGPEVLEIADMPKPVAGKGEIVIKVAAAAVNPADGKWRSGMFKEIAPLAFPHIVGYDVAGVVESGDGFPLGQRVVAMLDTYAKGGYAEYVKVNSKQVAVLPDNVSFVVAAAIPTAALTGLQLVERAIDVQMDQNILVTGAAGAVGRVAVFMAKASGARVVAGVRANQKDEARALGAEDVVVIGDDWTGARFDHVIDTVGGAEVAMLCRHLNDNGKIVTTATTPIDPIGLLAEPTFFSLIPDGEDLRRLVMLVSNGQLSMPVAQILPLDQAGHAQTLVEAGGTDGKILLEP